MQIEKMISMTFFPLWAKGNWKIRCWESITETFTDIHTVHGRLVVLGSREEKSPQEMVGEEWLKGWSFLLTIYLNFLEVTNHSSILEIHYQAKRASSWIILCVIHKNNTLKHKGKKRLETELTSKKQLISIMTLTECSWALFLLPGLTIIFEEDF